MGRGRAVQKQKIGLAVVAVALSVGQTHAQTPTSPVTGSVSLSTILDVDTNPGLTATPVTTTTLSEQLSFSIKTENRNQTFEFLGSTELSYGIQTGSSGSISITDPDFVARYTRDAANASINASANYRRGDITTIFDIDPSAAVVLVTDNGTVTTTGADIQAQIGKNAPLGVTFDLGYDNVDFAGTTDPNLFDTRTTTLGFDTRLNFSPVTTGNFRVNHTDYSAADATSTRTQTTTYDFALSHELRRALQIDLNLGYQTRDLTLSGITGTNDGFKAGVNLTQTLPNGSIFGGIGIDQTGAADRTSLSFGRSLTLPAGSLSASITAADVVGSSLQVFGSANYTQSLADGSFSVNLDQSLSTNQNNEDILFTRFGLGYQQQVTGTSDLNLSLDMSRSEDGGAGAAPTQNRATLAATYSRQLTQEWDMSVGYRHRIFSSSTSPQADSDTLFLTLTRNIQFGF